MMRYHARHLKPAPDKALRERVTYLRPAKIENRLEKTAALMVISGNGVDLVYEHKRAPEENDLARKLYIFVVTS
jgi:hypothetical protein